MDLFDYDYSKEEQADVPGEPAALSVAQAVETINTQLHRIAGPNLMVEGEVSDYSVSQGKWVRFDLKDLEGGALLKCFLTIYQLHVPLKDGDRIVVHATPKIYPRYGSFTLNVNQIALAGEGGLAAALRELKERLEKEGLFDEDRKRPLPVFPERIGLITSRDAAAFTDFLRILGNRWTDAAVDHIHVQVQGERAVGSICAAIEQFNAMEEGQRPDVLVLTRGGGGLEDLMAFNAEAVVRAVFGSKIPIVVGIGHERDESLAEYAADVRASTPSNAAERIAPDARAVLQEIDVTVERLQGRIEDTLRDRRYEVDRAVSSMQQLVQQVRFSVEQLASSMRHAGDKLEHMIQSRAQHVASITTLLQELDPKRLLARGYSIARKGGKIVKDASKLDKGDQLQVQFANGNIETEVV